MITENKIKRRNFFGYVGGFIGGIILLKPASFAEKSKKIFKRETKVVVKRNPLAVPRKKLD